MKYHTVSLSTEVAAPAQVVFDAITNWPKQSVWMLGTTVKGLDNDGKGLGGTLIARTSFGPFGFNDTMTITKWNPPYACVVTHTGKIVRGTGSFVVEAQGPSRATFIWSEDVEVPFGVIGTLGWHIAKIPLLFGVRWSLRRFKRWVE